MNTKLQFKSMKQVTPEVLAGLHKTLLKAEISVDDMVSRLQENAIEISMNNLQEMQKITALSRGTLINNYINDWAKEAELEWIGIWVDNGYCDEYIDFIDDFAARKLKEFKEKFGYKDTAPTKVAKLVSFYPTTRVVVDIKDIPAGKDADEAAIDIAIDKIKNNVDEYICAENCDLCEDDEECPYGTFEDEK